VLPRGELQHSAKDKVELRMGVYLVWWLKEAVYGDGVNLASRIESLAVPGGILFRREILKLRRNWENHRAEEMVILN